MVESFEEKNDFSVSCCFLLLCLLTYIYIEIYLCELLDIVLKCRPIHINWTQLHIQQYYISIFILMKSMRTIWRILC